MIIDIMQRRKFGDTDLEVSAISLGCWPFGVDWWGHYTDDQALHLMHFAHDQGITFFDSGDAYGNGRAESLLGQFLKTLPREKIEIGGKFGYDFYSDPGEPGSHKERKQDFSPKFLRFALEKSLERLGVETIDLYMAHNIKLPQFRDDLFAELEKIKSEGKIRVWGVSLGPAIGWREEGIQAMLDHNAKAVQTVYNLFEQNPGREFCEVAHSTHAGVLARVHDNSSILKDKVRLDTEISQNDHRKFRDQAWKIYGLKKLELIRHFRLRSRHERPPARLQMAPHGPRPHQHHRHPPQRRRSPRSRRIRRQAGFIPIRNAPTRRRLRPRLEPRPRRPPLRPQKQHIAVRLRPQHLRARPHPRPRQVIFMPRRRYVVLHHTGIPHPHYDLLFELNADSPLASVRCSDWPPTPTTKFERIPDHRRIYLEYEGEISANRGTVKRIATGMCEIEPDPDHFLRLTFEDRSSIRIPSKPPTEKTI